MEPKLPAPNLQPEQPPVLYEQSTERSQDLASEVVSEKSVERVGEGRAETFGQVSVAPVLPPPVVSVASVPIPSGGVAPSDKTVSDTPLVAADEDLIEKEWVDRAKKIVEETKDDPYRREQEVGKLQADYLRKRYGKELGAS